MNLLDKNEEELREIVKSYDMPEYRAKQLFISLQRYNNLSFSGLPKAFIEKLRQEHTITPITIYKKFESKLDETVKYALKLDDGNIIEAVLMTYKYGRTLCISTQIGCRMNCKFCASSLDGLIRNLSSGEMLAEVLCINADIGGGLGEARAITNIVLMGSGEPLDNYDSVVKFLKLVNDEKGLNISGRNISLSTCGIVPKIRQLIEDDVKVVLTLSLHACDDESRKKIMPIANAYSMDETISAFLDYVNLHRRGVVEYSLIEGVNDRIEDINKLSKYFKDQPVHFNIIRLNKVDERGLSGTSNNKAYSFMREMQAEGLDATLRRIMGSDIDGACGQLRRKIIKEDNNASN